MARKRSHWRDINGPKAHQLRLVRDVLKDASGPMTRGDVDRELERRGHKDEVEAIPTVIWELGQNPGYTTSGGVRFPDGKWRYWLLAAPDWSPRWIVTKDFKIAPTGTGERRAETPPETFPLQGEVGRNDSEVNVPGPPRLCLTCDHPAAPGSLFCADEACEAAYWNKLTGKRERD